MDARHCLADSRWVSFCSLVHEGPGPGSLTGLGEHPAGMQRNKAREHPEAHLMRAPDLCLVACGMGNLMGIFLNGRGPLCQSGKAEDITGYVRENLHVTVACLCRGEISLSAKNR